MDAELREPGVGAQCDASCPGDGREVGAPVARRLFRQRDQADAGVHHELGDPWIPTAPRLRAPWGLIGLAVSLIEANHHGPPGTFDDEIEITGSEATLRLAGLESVFTGYRAGPALSMFRDRQWREVPVCPGRPAVTWDNGGMLGTVAALRRYPVKSMLGEDVDASDVTFTGLTGDRRLAVLSRTTGKIASAKFPRLWRDLLTLSAAAADDRAANGTAVHITLPGGKTVWSSDADINAVLSGLLGQPVTLTAIPSPGAALDRAVPEAVLRDGVDAQVPAELMEIGGGGPPGTFVDFAPLHLLTTSTLGRIAELSPHGRADPER